MVNEIIDGISIKLNKVFGDAYRIYADEDLRQGLEEPCFFIALLTSARSPGISVRSTSESGFLIQYFSKKANCNTEMHDVGYRLIDALEFITLPSGDLLHGTKRGYEIVDGVLNFTVKIDMPLRREVETTPMEELSVQASTEG